MKVSFVPIFLQIKKMNMVLMLKVSKKWKMQFNIYLLLPLPLRDSPTSFPRPICRLSTIENIGICSPSRSMAFRYKQRIQEQEMLVFPGCHSNLRLIPIGWDQNQSSAYFWIKAKKATWTELSPTRRKFSGLMSRWITPTEWTKHQFSQSISMPLP